MPGQAKKARAEVRFGIAEWYGLPFSSLPAGDRQKFASIQSALQAGRPRCPFLSSADQDVPCWKKGGVCSLRKYEMVKGPDKAPLVRAVDSLIRTTCPSRFQENGEIYRWIGDTILGTADVVPIGQIPFLKPVPQMESTPEQTPPEKEVGRIDNILVVPNTNPLRWCAVEIQAVYFSGDKMKKDFEGIKIRTGSRIPFPAGRRRPDYRSSGPKRLLPQLQIKVPTLSTWGKKMAVVVDESFFGALGQMKPTRDLSNAEVIWFAVKYVETEGQIKLARGQTFMTRLEDAQAGLVAAEPVTLAQFEEKILAKLPKL